MPKEQHDFTWRGRLMDYLLEERIKASVAVKLTEPMRDKSDEEKEEIAKEALCKIETGEIQFTEEDRNPFSEKDYKVGLPLLQKLRSLPENTRITFVQLGQMVFGYELPSSYLWFRNLRFMAKQEGIRIVFEKNDDNLELPRHLRLFHIEIS